MHIATLRALVASSRCVDIVRRALDIAGAEIGEASIHVSIIVPSDNSKTKEKWNKSGSLKARAKRPLPAKALPIHGTWGRKNKN